MVSWNCRHIAPLSVVEVIRSLETQPASQIEPLLPCRSRCNTLIIKSTAKEKPGLNVSIRLHTGVSFLHLFPNMVRFCHLHRAVRLQLQSDRFWVICLAEDRKTSFWKSELVRAALLAAIALVTALPSTADVQEHPTSAGSQFIQEWSPAAAPRSPLDKFDDDFRNYRYVAVINDYKELSAKDKALPRICYDIAFSRLRKHDFVNAEAPLRSAIAGGFKGYDGLPTPAVLLARIEKLKRLCPPLKSDILNGTVRIKVYSKEMPWLSSVNAELPKFLEAAKGAFGDATPPITFYFFDNYSDYHEFFLALFDIDSTREKQLGTGDYNVVLFSAKDEKNQDSGSANINYKHGCILHEYGHALCNTVYGDNYLERIPDWLDEGLADELARPYLKQQHFSYYKKHLAEISVKEPPPSLEAMTSTMYQNSTDRYPFAHEMIDHMLEERGTSLFRPLLTKARELDGDWATAIKDVTGKTVESIYDQTVSDFWKQ